MVVKKKAVKKKGSVKASRTVVAKKTSASKKPAAKKLAKKLPAKQTAIAKKNTTKQTANKVKAVKNPVKKVNKVIPKNLKPAPRATPLKATVVKKPTPIKQPTARTRRPGAGPAGFLPYEPKSGEEYMNESQLTHFQHVLHLWKEQLYADRNATTQHMRDDQVNFPDPLDRASLEEEHTLEWRAREREHRLIIKIDQALANIKQGDYGYCEACGAEIGIRRLEARPTATQCIDCKTIDEIRERHNGSAE